MSTAGSGDSRYLLSVIVPVQRVDAAFARCLAALCVARTPGCEILVVVDGDDPAPAELAQRHGLRAVSTGQPSGPAVARNLGARLAQGEVLFFVDADVEVGASTLAQVETVFREAPELSALIGSYDDSPFEPNFCSQYKNLLHHYTHQHGREEAFTFWGACGAIRREVFVRVGGFDPSYRRPSIEDIELGYRLRAAGASVRLCKGLQVKHLKRWTAWSLLHTDFFCRALPWAALILRTRRFDNDLNISVGQRLRVALTHLLPVLLLLATWQPWLLAPACGVALTLAGLDVPLWRFFLHRRGRRFALGAIAWQWFAYWYSGLAFLLALAGHIRFREQGALREVS